jgi:hypothetical protein
MHIFILKRNVLYTILQSKMYLETIHEFKCMYGVWGSGIKLSYLFGKFIFTYEIYSTKRNRKITNTEFVAQSSGILCVHFYKAETK